MATYINDYSRREFLFQAGAGVAGLSLSVICGEPKGTNRMPSDSLDSIFPRYKRFDPEVPVWCVTPKLDGCMHRFHSSSPFSPSGRYLGLTQLPFEDRQPKPGETANVVVVDLKTGKHRVVAESRGWDVQLGAQVQWGATDSDLFFNDVDTKTWMPFGVRMDPETGKKKRLKGAIYMISPDGKWAVTTCLRRIGQTQAGYGVIVPSRLVPKNEGAPADDGVYVTNTDTGECRMIASYKKIVEAAKIDMSRYGKGDFYGFHTKWNAQSNRIMLVLRYKPKKGKARPQLITMTRDGGDIHVAIPASEWADKGGNHPNWHPDGEHVMMNLALHGKDWLYVQAKYDGSDLKTMTNAIANHGHPTLHPKGRYILTDCYPREEDAYGDGTVPLLWVDRKNHTKKALARMDVMTKTYRKKGTLNAGVMRVDLHPAWNPAYTHCAINGVMDGTRNVFVADLRSLLAKENG